MKHYLLLIFLGLSLTLIFSSCDKEGCTDPLAENFDSNATIDDGSCTYLNTEGCTDPLAENFNANATIDDGSCTYLSTDLTANIDQPTTIAGIVTVCGDITINSDLTITAGTVLNFCPNASLTVAVGGSLSAVGTQDNRIIFQGEQATKGFWEGINIRSNNPLNAMDFVDILHGGSYWGFDYSAVYMSANSRLSLTNSTIGASSDLGLKAEASSTLSAFSDNNFTDNLVGISLDADHIGALDEATTFSSNITNDIIMRGGSVSVPTTWVKTTVPILVTDWLYIGAALTLNPGVDIQFRQGEGAEVQVAGSLNAIGSATEKINLGGEFGVANGWGGLKVSSNNPNNVLEHVNISFGGSYWGYDYTNIYLKGQLSLDNCEVSGANSYGLIVTSSGLITSGGSTQAGASGVLANNTFSDNGLVGDNSCSPDCDIVFE